jgi:outer membrane biosynthesis protein TonB
MPVTDGRSPSTYSAVPEDAFLPLPIEEIAGSPPPPPQTEIVKPHHRYIAPRKHEATVKPLPIHHVVKPKRKPAPIRVVKPTPHPKPRPSLKPVTIHASASVASARAYALSVLGPTQFGCVDRLFFRESHWNPHEYVPSSGAYGIPQAVPGSKMRAAGADWRTNPLTQVRWGLSYIRARYGTACNALAHSDRYNWY